MGTRERVEILTPKRLAAIIAIGSVPLFATGHYWIGGGMVVAAFLLFWISDLKINP